LFSYIKTEFIFENHFWNKIFLSKLKGSWEFYLNTIKVKEQEIKKGNNGSAVLAIDLVFD
jgi:hypothetical protein